MSFFAIPLQPSIARLSWAREASPRWRSIEINNVKSARIEPAWLARAALPKRGADYLGSLKEDSAMRQAWSRLRPLSGALVKSWNYIMRARRSSIAINIETKGPMKSWTDGKPQIAIWTDAWLKRIALLRSAGGKWPAIPLLIAQGHGWHLLIVSRDDHEMIIRDQVAVGNTRSCFDAMKVVAVLHWLMNWAQELWRPWLLSSAS